GHAFAGDDLLRARLIEATSTHRLVTLLGPGGVGKTRLAQETASCHPNPWPGGVSWCDLSGSESEGDVCVALARALTVMLDRDPVAQLDEVLGRRGRQLLVLDNVEPIVSVIRPLVARWTRAAAGLTVLVTSQEALDLPAEHQVVLGPLNARDAEALYLQAATAVEATVPLSAADRAALPELLRLLDYLPLAIELAAARIRLLPPAPLLARLGDRFDVLARRRAAHRHDSLAATVAWSWSLLDAPARAALTRLSVFEGGFTLGAAEAVLNVPEALDQLQELVNRSWVSRVAHDRYRLLITIRAYVRRRGTDTESAEQHHGAYFARLGRGIVNGAAPGPLKSRILADVDNVVVALRRAIRRRDGAVAFETLVAAWVAFTTTGPYSAWMALAEEVSGVFDLSASQHAEVTSRWCTALRAVGRADESRAMLETSLRAVRDGSLTGLTAARVRLQHGRFLQGVGRLDEAAEEFARSLQDLRRLDLPVHEVVVLRAIGLLEAERSRPADARRAYEAALSLALAAEDPHAEAWTRCKLGTLACHQRRFDEALTELRAAHQFATTVGNRELEAEALHQLGGVHRHIGTPEENIAYREQALDVVLSLGHQEMAANVRLSLARVYLDIGEAKQARAHIEPALAALDRLRSAGTAARVHLAAADVASAQQALDVADRHYRMAIEVCRDAGFRHLEGYALAHWARLHIAQDQADRARALVTTARAVASEVDDRDLDRLVQELWLAVELDAPEVSPPGSTTK
ncbi:MAG: tetratricopeptide repeat protein, partial [Myxococcota bacterium]